MTEYDELLKIIKDTLEKIHKSIEAITAQQNTSERAKQISAHIDSQVDVGLPIEVSEYYRSEQSEREPKNRRERVRLGVEIVGVITALILVALTLKTFLVLRGQLMEMQSQTTILRNQADQATRDAASTRTRKLANKSKLRKTSLGSTSDRLFGWRTIKRLIACSSLSKLYRRMVQNRYL